MHFCFTRSLLSKNINILPGKHGILRQPHYDCGMMFTSPLVHLVVGSSEGACLSFRPPLVSEPLSWYLILELWQQTLQVFVSWLKCASLSNLIVCNTLLFLLGLIEILVGCGWFHSRDNMARNLSLHIYLLSPWSNFTACLLANVHVPRSWVPQVLAILGLSHLALWFKVHNDHSFFFF